MFIISPNQAKTNRFFASSFRYMLVVCGLLAALHPYLSSALAQDNPANTKQLSLHQSKNATEQFDLHSEIEVGLFAAEPMMANPSNIDIDHLGRVWVCEVVNYRHFRNQDATPREEGDRILILEDTDGDATADSSTVFYQGRDIDSAHGICVLGDRAIVSANDSVFYLIDTDGDLKADKKEVLFTGISGTQHDHGIHAFVFGPDGKLYFNFGNAGKQIRDADGNPIIDLAGNEVKDDRKPYNQGMIFRCNLDGSEFETLAWNFRNNWEMCIDSFGSIWQSDNDDDGNRSTRINFVMPFGDYGYTQQQTGENWKTARTGMENDIPNQHWHQNDPGVVPNLLLTGAGSPTGICVYEGSLLPDVFHNQMIHCDAGPSIVRCYPVKKRGAGYTAEIVNMIDGAKKNQWFRPSDVCVAPDGSLIVADWYDPGVGGHRMQDVERGRLFHVTKKGAGGKYTIVKPDFSNPESAANALKSPNQATRYLAWTALEEFGASINPSTITAVKKLWHDENPRIRARGLWMLMHIALPKKETVDYLKEALDDPHPDIRVTAIRAIVHLRDVINESDVGEHVNINDEAADVRREILIGLRQFPTEDFPELWAQLATQHESGDRWYLEALGIAADGRWNECLTALLGDEMQLDLANPAELDIIWRSRGSQTPHLLTHIIANESITAEQATRYFRAFDFLPDASKQLASLAFDVEIMGDKKSKFVAMESASRLDLNDLSSDQKAKLNSLIEQSRGTPEFIDFVEKFSSTSHYDELLKIAASINDRQQAADAMRVLMEKEQFGIVNPAVINADEVARETICDSLVNCGQRRAAFVFGGIAKRDDLDTPLRTYAIKRLGEIRSGAGDMLWWIDQGEKIDPVIMPAIEAALHRSKWPEIKEKANELFPMAPSKDNKPLPAVTELAKRSGEIANGQKIYAGVGTCAKCHIVNKQGVEVGPDLTEIGSKLTKEALYESILFPSAGISHNYENWIVIKLDGTMITGVLLGETEQEIQLKDDKGITHKIPNSDVDDKKPQKLSLMPADLHKELSEQELVDLVEYLMSLKKK